MTATIVFSHSWLRSVRRAECVRANGLGESSERKEGKWCQTNLKRKRTHRQWLHIYVTSTATGWSSTKCTKFEFRRVDYAIDTALDIFTQLEIRASNSIRSAEQSSLSAPNRIEAKENNELRWPNDDTIVATSHTRCKVKMGDRTNMNKCN